MKISYTLRIPAAPKTPPVEKPQFRPSFSGALNNRTSRVIKIGFLKYNFVYNRVIYTTLVI